MHSIPYVPQQGIVNSCILGELLTKVNGLVKLRELLGYGPKIQNRRDQHILVGTHRVPQTNT